jgi:hypothetical protein
MAKLILKLVVSAILFAVILSRIDIAGASKVIAGANVPMLSLALLVSLILVVADAMLWKTVLRALGHRISLAPAITYSIVGSFFGMLGPSLVGIDLFRTTQMQRLGIPIGTAVRAVVTTRLTSFASLLAIIASGFPITLGYDLAVRDKIAIISILAVGIAALTTVLLLGAICARFPALQKLGPIRTAAAISTDLAKVLKTSRHAPVRWLYSALTHLLRILTFAMIASALNAHVGLWAFYALVPVALLVAMIPVSLGSWGVREASVIFFLGWAGVPGETALGISVVFGLFRMLVSACGGIVWLTARTHHYSLEVAGVAD